MSFFTYILTLVSSTLFSGSTVQTFLNDIRALSYDTYFGLATFNAPSTLCLTAVTYTLRCALTCTQYHSCSFSDFVINDESNTASQSDFTASTLITLNLNALCPSSSSGSQLAALRSASSAATGWRSGSYKVIIMITDKNYGQG